jgi:hypothetical protein
MDLESTSRETALHDRVEAVARKLFAYCRASNWAGYDPYDALNSRIVEALPFLQTRVPALVLTQGLKRSPLNVRSLLLVPKKQNPKGLALFLSSVVRAPRLAGAESEEVETALLDRILALRSEGSEYWCWGYSFPWRGRDMIVPRWSPNLVCTQFVGTALLDLYERRGDPRHLEIAVSAADYILNELYWTSDDGKAGFSYPLPTHRNIVHNANLLASSYLCRVHRHSGLERFRTPALRAARLAIALQREDGSWPYGEGRHQEWIDNFHTCYNLSALQSIGRDLDTDEFQESIDRGLAFYLAHFFREDGAARYFHDRTYPIDIHSVAVAIITLLEFRSYDAGNAALAEKVLQWAVRNMWSKRGFFHYRVLRLCKIRTPYIRWSEAWMLRALAEYLHAQSQAGEPEQPKLEEGHIVC